MPQPEGALLVGKHDYVPKSARKFLDRVQTVYPRKNWSSLMPPRRRAAPLCWLEDPHIGEPPLEWNWLVAEYPYNPEARIVHFTIGGPWFAAYRDCDYADEWFAEFESMRYRK